eukprot:4159980-Amphidinium_carterae.2
MRQLNLQVCRDMLCRGSGLQLDETASALLFTCACACPTLLQNPGHTKRALSSFAALLDCQPQVFRPPAA